MSFLLRSKDLKCQIFEHVFEKKTHCPPSLLRRVNFDANLIFHPVQLLEKNHSLHLLGPFS